MTLLVTIVTNGLKKILLIPSTCTSTSTWIILQGVCYINPGSRGGISRPSFLVVSFLFLLFLFFLPNLLEDFSAIRVLKSWGFFFLGPRVRFFDPWVLHWQALGTSFGCWWSTTLETVLIVVASIGAKPESGFGFSVNNFFDYFYKAIKLSVALLHIDLH